MVGPPASGGRKRPVPKQPTSSQRRQHSASVRIRAHPWMAIGQPPPTTTAAVVTPSGTQEESHDDPDCEQQRNNINAFPPLVKGRERELDREEGVVELTSSQQVEYVVKESGLGLPFNKRSRVVGKSAANGKGTQKADAENAMVQVETQLTMVEPAVTKVFRARPVPPRTMSAPRSLKSGSTQDEITLSQKQRNVQKWTKRGESARTATSVVRKTLKSAQFRGAADAGSAVGNLTRWPAPANPSIDLLEECTRLLRHSANRKRQANKSDQTATEKKPKGVTSTAVKTISPRGGDEDDLNASLPPSPSSVWNPPALDPHVDVSIEVLGNVVKNFRHIVVDKQHGAEDGTSDEKKHPAQPEVFDLVSFFSHLDDILQASFEHEMDAHNKRTTTHINNDVIPSYETALKTLQDVETMTNEKATEAERNQRVQTKKFHEDVASIRSELEGLMVKGLSREDKLVQLHRRYAILHDRFTAMSGEVAKQREMTSTLSSLSKLNSQLHHDVNMMVSQLEVVKEYKQRVKNDAELEVQSVENEQRQMVRDLKSALSDIQWFGERQRSVKLRLEEEAQREFYIRDEIDKWKDKALNQPIERSANLTPRPKWDEHEMLDTCHLRTALHHLKAASRNNEGGPNKQKLQEKKKKSISKFSRSTSPSSSGSATPKMLEGSSTPPDNAINSESNSKQHRMTQSRVSTTEMLSFGEELEQLVPLTTEQHVNVILDRLSIHQKQSKHLLQEQQKMKARPGMAKLLDGTGSAIPFSIHHVAQMLPKNDALVFRALEHSLGAGLQCVLPIWNESEAMSRCLYLWLHILRRRGKKAALEMVSVQDASASAMESTSSVLGSGRSFAKNKHYNSICHSAAELLNDIRINENAIRESERAKDGQASPQHGAVPLIGSTADLAVEPGRRLSTPQTKLLIPTMFQPHRFSIASAVSEGEVSEYNHQDVLSSPESQSLPGGANTEASANVSAHPSPRQTGNPNDTPLGSGFTAPVPPPPFGGARQRQQSVVVVDPAPEQQDSPLHHGGGTKTFGTFTRKALNLLHEDDLHSLLFWLGKTFPQTVVSFNDQTTVRKDVNTEKVQNSPPGSSTVTPTGSQAFVTSSSKAAISSAVSRANDKRTGSRSGPASLTKKSTTDSTGIPIDSQQVSQAVQASQESLLLNVPINQSFVFCLHQVLSHTAPVRLLDLFLVMTRRIMETCETAYTQHYKGQYLPQMVVIRAIKKAYDERQMSAVYKMDCLKALQGVSSIDWHGEFRTTVTVAKSPSPNNTLTSPTSFSGAPASGTSPQTVGENVIIKAISHPISEVTSCSKRASDAIDPQRIVEAYFSGDSLPSSSNRHPTLPMLAPMFNRIMTHLYAEQQFLLAIVGRIMTDVSISSETRPGLFLMSIEKFEQALAEEIVNPCNAGLPSSLGAARVRPKPGHFLSPNLGVRGLQKTGVGSSSSQQAKDTEDAGVDLQETAIFGSNAVSMANIHGRRDADDEELEGGFTFNAALIAEHIAKSCTPLTPNTHFLAKKSEVEEKDESHMSSALGKSPDSSVRMTTPQPLIVNVPGAVAPRTAETSVMNDPIDSLATTQNGVGLLSIDVDELGAGSKTTSPATKVLPAVTVEASSFINNAKRAGSVGMSDSGGVSTSRRGSLAISTATSNVTNPVTKPAQPTAVPQATVGGQTVFVTPYQRERNPLGLIFHTALVERHENLLDEVVSVGFHRQRYGSDSQSRSSSHRTGSKSVEEQKHSQRRRSSGASSVPTTPRSVTSSAAATGRKSSTSPGRQGSVNPLEASGKSQVIDFHTADEEPRKVIDVAALPIPTCIEDVFVVDGTKASILKAEDVVDVEEAFARARMLCIRMYLREIQ